MPGQFVQLVTDPDEAGVRPARDTLERAGSGPPVCRPVGRASDGWQKSERGEMKNTATKPTVLQMRLVVETPDYDEALRFYRDVLGAAVELQVDGENGERVTILDVGRATLELSNPAQVAMIDDVEVGRRVSPRLRVAFEVEDAAEATRRLVDGGAELIAEPTRTPWNSLNSRLDAPASLQLTLFQELGEP